MIGRVNLEVRLEAKGDKSYVDWHSSWNWSSECPRWPRVFEDSLPPPIHFKATGAYRR